MMAEKNIGALPVVDDLEGEFVAGLVDDHPAVLGGRVAHDVGDGLLDDAERGQVDVGGQRAPRPGPPHVHADARVLGGRGQPAQVSQPGRRAERREVSARLRLAQCRQRPPQPGQRLPAGGLDGVERVASLGRLRVDDPAAHPGLDRDDADAVRDHVMQLASDPQPLGHDRLGRALRAQRFGVAAALPDRLADHPGGDGGQGGERHHGREML